MASQSLAEPMEATEPAAVPLSPLASDGSRVYVADSVSDEGGGKVIKPT